MSTWARFSFLMSAIAAFGWLASAGCSSTDTGSTGAVTDCVEVVPDAGAVGLACDLGWSCNSDTQRFEIQCTTDADGNYTCDCLSEGMVTRTFKVNPFDCKGTEARSAGNAGCGWQIM